MPNTFVTTRAAATLIISSALGYGLYRLSGDPRMSLFVFLATCFCGYLFTMVSVATREE